MATVFFKVSEQQDLEIHHFMSDEGYENKSEFFRFLLKFYKYQRNEDLINFHQATEDLSNTLLNLDKKGKLDHSLEDQLADV